MSGFYLAGKWVFLTFNTWIVIAGMCSSIFHLCISVSNVSILYTLFSVSDFYFSVRIRLYVIHCHKRQINYCSYL